MSGNDTALFAGLAVVIGVIAVGVFMNKPKGTSGGSASRRNRKTMTRKNRKN